MSTPNIAMMKERVTLEIAKTTPDGYSGLYGTPQFETDTQTLLAREVDLDEVIRGTAGEERVAERAAFIHSPTRRIKPLDKITFSDGESPRILRVRAETDTLGLRKVYLVTFGNSRRTG